MFGMLTHTTYRSLAVRSLAACKTYIKSWALLKQTYNSGESKRKEFKYQEHQSL